MKVVQSLLIGWILHFISTARPAASDVTSGRFLKVAGTQKGIGCLLESHVFAVKFATAGACLSRCLAVADCRFFCVHSSERTCTLYYAYVALHWAGEATGKSYSACYTSWGKRGNIITEDAVDDISAPSFYNNEGTLLGTRNSLDGLACGCFSFSTALGSNGYWHFDMKTPKKVKEVIFAIQWDYNFNGAVIKLGNNSAYQANPVYGTPAHTDTHGSVAVVSAGEVTVGRFLTVLKAPYGYLEFCEIQIIVE